MHCFNMPAYSHLTDFLHLESLYSNGDRRVLPRSPFTTQIAPHFPGLSLSHTSHFSFTHPFFQGCTCLLLSRSRGELTWLGALGGSVGLL